MGTVIINRTALGGAFDCPHCSKGIQTASGTPVPDNGLIHNCPHCSQPICLACGSKAESDGQGGHFCPQCRR
ncbi:MAG: hypothetical protein WC675_05535 [Patescibacteria group bacterium]